eukprot:gene11475-7944_t
MKRTRYKRGKATQRIRSITYHHRDRIGRVAKCHSLAQLLFIRLSPLPFFVSMPHAGSASNY